MSGVNWRLQLALSLALLINMLSIGSQMMVMPLGPDFVLALGMDAAHIGYFSGAATLGSAAIGFLLAPYLDRFNKKHGLVLVLALKGAFLAACTLAQTSEALFFWYLLSGCCSGPLIGLLMASVIDLTPENQRGRAMAFVASGFSLAAIIAVPISLAMAGYLGWQSSFWLFALLSWLLALGLSQIFPSLPGRAMPGEKNGFWHLLQQPLGSKALFVGAVAMFGHSLLIPNFSSYFQFNLDFPREQIPYLFAAGGICSLLALRVSGRVVDAGWGVAQLWVSSALIALASTLGFLLWGGPGLYISFMVFMSMSSVRTSTVTAMISRVPAPHQRAAFMSYHGTMTSVASALGSFLAAQYLRTSESQQLIGFDHLVICNLLALLLVPWLMLRLQQALLRRSEAVTG